MTDVRRRLASVDAFRALTMLLMIFVNDLVSVKGVPEWLEHAGEKEDRMGLADVVFPAFLFIVGLSIPFALDQRKTKGISRGSSFWHILKRSFALLAIGIFQVNYENYNRSYGFQAMYWWLLWTTVGIFLIWLQYPPSVPVWLRRLLQGIGILLMVWMAIVYKGGDAEHVIWMRTDWYGILGLIGWCYLICASLYLWLGERTAVLTVLMGFFLTLCVLDRATGLHFFHPLRQFVWIVGSGSLPAITMTGVIAAVLYRRGVSEGRAMRSLWLLSALAVVMLAGGFIFRPFWGISKIRSTPSWVMICTGISLLAFALLAYITDIKGHEGWYKPIRAAGTASLTCYLLTYLHFAIAHLIGWRIPVWMRTDGVGVFKSMVYAFVIVWIARWLENRKLKLSI